LDVVSATGAKRVIATHGYAESVARYLSARGIEAGVLAMESEAGSADRQKEEA